jgi:hypothetical protein
MQSELDENYPELDIEILGINQLGQEAGNANATSGKSIPWLQDVDADQDGRSDVWANSWPVQWRDVAIVDADNVQIDVYNVTTFNLENPDNYATLMQKLIDAAQAQTLPTSWTNPELSLDVNGDTSISSIDSLLVLNELNSVGPRQLSPPSEGDSPPPYLDTSGDGYATSIDALLVLNHLNSLPISAEAARSVAAVPVTSTEAPPAAADEQPEELSETELSESLAAIAAALAVDEIFDSQSTKRN